MYISVFTSPWSGVFLRYVMVVRLSLSDRRLKSERFSLPAESWRRPERRDQGRPASMVGLAPHRSIGAESLPSGLDDVEPAPAFAKVDERELDFGGLHGVTADVPGVAKSTRWAPLGHDTPIDLRTIGGALEDAPAQPGFEHNNCARVAGSRVPLRPPSPNAGGPHLERVVGGTSQLVGQSKRLDHGGSAGVVFSASSVKRPTASPHTAVR